MEKENQSHTSEQIEDRIDRLLSKYVTVWLWSILFGGNTGLGASFLVFTNFQAWGSQLGILVAVLLGIGLFFILSSLFSLFRYFARFLVPVFILHKKVDLNEEDRISAAITLRSAFLNLIMASALRIAVMMVQFVYSSLR